MNNYWLVVYHTTENDFHDLGNDPYFKEKPFSWGICRPDVRRLLSLGDYVYFVGKKGKRYFLNGYFRVKETINYVEALKRFPQRENTLISEINSNVDRLKYLKEFIINESPKWRDSKGSELMNTLLKVQNNLNFSRNHLPFYYISHSGKLFIHRADDDHESDNWKCRRIFNCYIQTKKYCLEKGFCIREREFENQSYYIIGDKEESCFIDSAKIPFDELHLKLNISILPDSNFGNSLRKGNYHPKIALSKYQHTLLQNYFNIQT